MRPIIGITMNEKPGFGAELRRQYYEALTAAGALPLALPPLPGDLAAQTLDLLDGLLLSGGGDIEPRHYGEEPLPELGQTEPARDLWELALTKEAWRRGLPILAICRGMQMLNVALSGTLWQDTAYIPGKTLAHSQTEPPEQVTQNIRVTHPWLSALLGWQNVMVNSHHHQMLRDIAPALTLAALAEDNVVEAVLPAGPYPGFCLGAQWHPERLDDEESRRIFAAFVAAAQEYGETK